MSDEKLRKHLIKLAYERPEFRDDLLPLVKKSASEKLKIDAGTVHQVVYQLRDGIAGMVEKTAKKDARKLGISKVEESIKSLSKVTLFLEGDETEYAVSMKFRNPLGLDSMSGAVIPVEYELASRDGSVSDRKELKIPLGVSFSATAGTTLLEAMAFFEKATS